MKKLILSLVLAAVASLGFAASANAVDYTITVDNNQATRNQQFVFQYLDIAPGFSSDAPINIVNNANSSAEVKLLSIKPVNQAVAPKPAPANNLLPYVNLSLLRDGVTMAQGTAADTSGLIGATFCVPAAQTEQLTTRFSLPTSVGNEAQNTSLWIEYTFQISVGPCGVVAPPDTSGRAIKPPNTAETSLPFLVMGGTFATAFLVALIFASFLLVGLLRRRKDSERYARKY